MIHLLRNRATRQQLEEMLKALEMYVKLAVDIQRGIVAGGGPLHADCEAVLLADGSLQEKHIGRRLDSIDSANPVRCVNQHKTTAKQSCDGYSRFFHS